MKTHRSLKTPSHIKLSAAVACLVLTAAATTVLAAEQPKLPPGFTPKLPPGRDLRGYPSEDRRAWHARCLCVGETERIFRQAHCASE